MNDTAINVFSLKSILTLYERSNSNLKAIRQNVDR